MKIEIDKPVVPSFVSDWIEQLYGQGFTSDDLLESLFARNYHIANLKIFKWFAENKYDFIIALASLSYLAVCTHSTISG